MPTALETALTTVVPGLLECVRVGLAATEAGAPDRVCEVPGQLAWDGCECGTLAVTVDRIFQSATFPQPAGDNELAAQCASAYLAVDATVTVLRCAPNPQGTALAPTCTALDAAALAWFIDMDAVRSALACCLLDMRTADTIVEFVLRDTVPAGPQGGCVGSDTRLTFGIANCLCAV